MTAGGARQPPVDFSEFEIGPAGGVGNEQEEALVPVVAAVGGFMKGRSLSAQRVEWWQAPLGAEAMGGVEQTDQDQGDVLAGLRCGT